MRFCAVFSVLLWVACPSTPEGLGEGEACENHNACVTGLQCENGTCTAPQPNPDPPPAKSDAGHASQASLDAGVSSSLPNTDAGSPLVTTDAGTALIPLLDSGLNDTEDCTATCAEREWVCGQVCGEACGTCTNGELCGNGSCWSSHNELSCDTCSLQLTVTQATRVNGQITNVTLAIDYSPTSLEPLPRLVDLYLNIDTTAQPVSVTEGDALTQASKNLSADPQTGHLWLDGGENTLRFLAFSAGNTNTIGAGRLLTISLMMQPLHEQALVFSLVKREENFAPAEADQALHGQDYDMAVVVFPTE